MVVKPDDSTPVADVQERSQKINNTEEMLGYPNELSIKDRAKLLVTLCNYNPEDHKMVINAAAFPPRSVNYMS